MRTTTWCKALVVTFSSLLVPQAWGVEVAYEFLECEHQKYTPLAAPSPAVTAVTIESWGIMASSTVRDWENATKHCVATWRVLEGKETARGMCRWTDLAGNTAVGEWEQTAPGEGTWTFLTGTGKFKGIKGGGKFKVVVKGPPAAEGTGQSCTRDKGTYSLPG